MFCEACDWLRGVDLNHRPLGYESNSAAQAGQPQAAKRKQTLRSALPELLRFAPLCTQFTDKTRTETFFRVAGRMRRTRRPVAGLTRFAKCHSC